MSSSLKDQYASSPLFGGNATAVEALYEQFMANPDAVSEGWRRYFRTLGNGQAEVAHSPIRQRLLERARTGKGYGQTAAVELTSITAAEEKQSAVSRLIQV